MWHFFVSLCPVVWHIGYVCGGQKRDLIIFTRISIYPIARTHRPRNIAQCHEWRSNKTNRHTHTHTHNKWIRKKEKKKLWPAHKMFRGWKNKTLLLENAKRMQRSMFKMERFYDPSNIFFSYFYLRSIHRIPMNIRPFQPTKCHFKKSNLIEWISQFFFLILINIRVFDPLLRNVTIFSESDKKFLVIMSK